MTQKLSQLITEMQTLRAGLADGSARNAAGEPASGDVDAAIDALDQAIVTLTGATADTAASDPAEPDVAPYAIVAAAPGAPDDLRKIRGISSATAYALTNVGITRYAHVAGLTALDVAHLKTDLSYRCTIHRDNWIEQAAVLAAGGSTSFSRRGGPAELLSGSAAVSEPESSAPVAFAVEDAADVIAVSDTSTDVSPVAAPEVTEATKLEAESSASVVLPAVAAAAAFAPLLAEASSARTDFGEPAEGSTADDVTVEPAAEPTSGEMPAPEVEPEPSFAENLIDMPDEQGTDQSDRASLIAVNPAEPETVDPAESEPQDEDTVEPPVKNQPSMLNGAHVAVAGTLGALIAGNLASNGSADDETETAPIATVDTEAADEAPDLLDAEPEAVAVSEPQPEIETDHSDPSIAPALVGVAMPSDDSLEPEDSVSTALEEEAAPAEDDVFATLPEPVAVLASSSSGPVFPLIEPTISVPRDFQGGEPSAVPPATAAADETVHAPEPSPARDATLDALATPPQAPGPQNGGADTIAAIDAPSLQEPAQIGGLNAMLEGVAPAPEMTAPPTQPPIPNQAMGPDTAGVRQNEAPFAPVIRDVSDGFNDTISVNRSPDADLARIHIVDEPEGPAPTHIEAPVSDAVAAETLRTELEAQFSPSPKSEEVPPPVIPPRPRPAMANRLSPGPATIDPLPQPFSPHKTAVDEAEIVIVRDGKQDTAPAQIPELSDRGGQGGLIGRISRMFARKE